MQGGVEQRAVTKEHGCTGESWPESQLSSFSTWTSLSLMPFLA